ncbi:hypothetical protein MMC12_003341 [Toensbergia leucococca]|nr:hypothetical protein [Toensbergia leucococca]
MQSKHLRIHLLLTLIAVAHALPQQNPAGPILSELSQSGNFAIYACGSQTDAIKTLLDLSYLYLQTAILSTDSAAYKAFFKDTPPSNVTAVLNRIAEGSSILTGNLLRRPCIICVTQQYPGLANAWDRCKANPNVAILHEPNTALMYLCPVAMTIQPSPVSSMCPAINPWGTGFMGGIPMTRYAVIVDTLAYMYIPTALPGKTVLQPPVMDVGNCLGLEAEKAVRNPHSYGLYTSYLRAGCTQFPTKVPADRDRELMESTEPVGADGIEIGPVLCVDDPTLINLYANTPSCPT